MGKLRALMRAKDPAHIFFELGLIIKAADGIMEIIGALFLLYLNPVRLSNIVSMLTMHELSQDPDDLVANALIRLSRSFSISTQHFAVIYLVTHGAVKCLLVFLLLRKKFWAYPLTMAFLAVFIIYQLYHFFISGSLPLLLLSVFDAVMVWLTFLEYRKGKSAA